MIQKSIVDDNVKRSSAEVMKISVSSYIVKNSAGEMT